MLTKQNKICYFKANMGLNILFFLSGILLWNVEANSNCDALGVNFYAQIGCKPEPYNTSCPSNYRCIKYPSSDDECVFGSEIYEDGDRIFGGTPCSYCECYSNEGDLKEITCFASKCPRPPVLNETCFLSRELDECCGTKVICPSPDDPTCNVDGVAYREGEIFSPNNTCWDCICKGGFREGIYNETFCVKKMCNFAMNFRDEINGKCAALYSGSNRENGEALCCPDDFICPNKIVGVNEVVKMKGTKICTLGKYIVKLNGAVSVTYNNNGAIQNATCSCTLPPYLTCRN